MTSNQRTESFVRGQIKRALAVIAEESRYESRCGKGHNYTANSWKAWLRTIEAHRTLARYI